MNEIIPAQLTIRCASESDLTALEWDGEFSHFRRLFADTFEQVVAGKAKIWIAEIPTHFLIGQIFVSLNGARPELADGITRAYLYGFRVKPTYRNRDVGRRMMETVEDDLWKIGFQIVTLNVAQANLSAQRFYLRIGYTIEGSDPGRWFYQDQFGQRHEVVEPAWRMEKRLP